MQRSNLDHDSDRFYSASLSANNGNMLISVGEQHLPGLNEQLQMWYSDIIVQNWALAERYSQRRLAD
jgi:hypothetical protein